MPGNKIRKNFLKKKFFGMFGNDHTLESVIFNVSDIKWYDWIIYFILFISGINWLLTAFDFNLVEKIGLVFFPSYSVTFAFFKTIVYIIMGLTGVYGIYIGIKIWNTEKISSNSK